VLFYLKEEQEGKQAPWLPVDAEGVMAADEIMPSQIVQIDSSRIVGLITRSGSRTSHSAILARSMRIPAITGMGENFAQLRDGSMVILDGFTGRLIQDPDE